MKKHKKKKQSKKECQGELTAADLVKVVGGGNIQSRKRRRGRRIFDGADGIPV